MTGGFPLGRIFGIAIRIDWSWLFIFAWVTFNLGAGVFPALHPDWPPSLTWGVAIVASLIFFASVLAHELAHSLVAKSRGLPVESITLFLFGGVSNLQREPPSPRAEFLITIVGPLTSIVLGVLFYFLSQVSASQAATFAAGGLSATAQLNPLATLLLWLGSINVLLGVFNLVPGFPLDGGRLLRAVLWALSGNLRRATRWAAWVGEGIGWLFIAAGFVSLFGGAVPFLGANLFSALWIMFIGWFLKSAAAQSYRQVVLQDVLRGVPVARLMRTNVATTPPTASVDTLVHDHILGTDERAFPVVQDDRLLGLICLDDVRRVPRAEWESTTVAQAMTPADKLVTVAPQDAAGTAVEALSRQQVNQLPVLQDGHLVGLLTQRDILKWLQLHADETKG